jgi:hypothetical protein
MKEALRVTKDMLKYRENILTSEFDTLVFDMDSAIDEFIFAFQGEQEREFNLAHINKVINHSAKNKLGLGEGMKKIVMEYEFPFREKSLFMKEVLVLDINGGMKRIFELENYNLGNLMETLKLDQIKGREMNVIDVRRYLEC